MGFNGRHRRGNEGHRRGGNDRSALLRPALVPVTHRGKPPALRGDSPRFYLCNGLRDLLVFAKREEIHDEEDERYDQMRLAIG